jgi:hypothetical protein
VFWFMLFAFFSHTFLLFLSDFFSAHLFIHTLSLFMWTANHSPYFRFERREPNIYQSCVRRLQHVKSFCSSSVFECLCVTWLCGGVVYVYVKLSSFQEPLVYEKIHCGYDCVCVWFLHHLKLWIFYFDMHIVSALIDCERANCSMTKCVGNLDSFFSLVH